ncbi:porin family protein [bacterium]|nr:porin family protein [bacterium]MBU1957949.1 porin family protein [bacterium]
MKKIIMSLVLAGGLAMAGSFAQVGLGYSQGDEEGNFATGFAGINVLGNIGLRLEYTKNISEHAEFSKEDISRYGLFATYTLPLTSSFSITPKAGLTKADGDFTVKDTVQTVSDSSTEFTYGLEANYHYNDNIALFVGYTDYGKEFDINSIDTSKMDTKNYTFGIKLDI